ncbi:RsmG family class I SAM-dependent methyltransferase, partial [Faecalibacterium sp. DFI.5.82]|uniref:RsmG family class I SAM-dependent methyltransferase n=1 Tax=Faecalibacterium sp. DFI.5.82 TaxID=3031725 RepID=UPI0023B137C1
PHRRGRCAPRCAGHCHTKERAEEAARKAWREQFDLASARAVAALPMLAEYCLPLVKVGGSFLAMKGASGEEELAAARQRWRCSAPGTAVWPASRPPGRPLLP